MRLRALYELGTRRVALASWPSGQYLEISSVGGFLSPIGKLRCADGSLPDQDVVLVQIHPDTDWIEYVGPSLPLLEGV